MNRNEAIQTIVERFISNVQGKKADVTKANKRHDGKEGHWLEKQMGIAPNANNAADIFGFKFHSTLSNLTIAYLSVVWAVLVCTVRSACSHAPSALSACTKKDSSSVNLVQDDCARTK